MPDLLLLRHGQTEWSRVGRHTGRTDLPLTDEGRAQATALRPVVERLRPCAALVSPLVRARDTAELAGLADVAATEPDLQEWDYGRWEGVTTPDVRAELGYAWSVFADGAEGGESVEDVGARADRALARAASLGGDDDVVALVAHGHLLRVVTARYLGLPPGRGASFPLETGTWCLLGRYHGEPAVEAWNVPAAG